MSARVLMSMAAALLLLGIGGDAGADVDPGDRVECNWKSKGKYYKGKVHSRSGSTVVIHYDDGDKETTVVSRCRSLAAAKSASPGGIEKGARVECNWKARGHYYPGVVMWRNGKLAGIQYDDGDRESEPVTRCRLAGRTAAPPKAPAESSQASTGSSTPPRPAAAEPKMDPLFADGIRRLRAHPKQSNQRLDPKIPGEYVRLEAVGTTHVVHNIARFAGDGTGVLTIEKWGLDRNDRLVRDTSRTSLDFTWGVETLRVSSTVTAPMLRITVQDGTSFTLVYGMVGTTLGTVFLDTARNIAGEKMLFRGRREFDADWNANAGKIRTALIDARRTRQRIDALQLQTRTMKMGNDNLLMLRTMNMGWTGMATF